MSKKVEGERMSTKSAILRELEARRGEFLSGEELAKKLGVTRNAIWKGVSALKNDGLEIDSVPNKGYRLADDAAVTAEEIEKYLNTGCKIEVFSSTTSTNDEARRLAESGAEEGRVAVAISQTAGRGRVGRSFSSQKKEGIYFSVVLRPDMERARFITVTAAVAVAEAIEQAGGRKTGVKWVNDVYAHGKKCVGVLTEAVTDLESGGIEYAVLGIGVNLKKPSCEELKDIAEAAFDEGVKDCANKVVAYTLNRFFELYRAFDKSEIVSRYRAKCFVIGMDVDVIKGDCARRARALGLDDECRLEVEYENGEKERLCSGEVSIKW